MKVKLLPSSFEEDGSPSPRQHLACIVVDDLVSIDAGSLAMAATDTMRRQLRDVVVTHAHLDHIAGLPLYVDDLFATLDSPVRVHALAEVIEVLERDVFNWSVFPRFSELSTQIGPPLEYHTIEFGKLFNIRDLQFRLFPANHKVPSAGVTVSDANSTIAITGDTSSLDGLSQSVGGFENVKAILVECAFPDELGDIAASSHHMTPAVLRNELEKLPSDIEVFVINIKPRYREAVIAQIAGLKLANVNVMEVGKDYFW